MSRRKWIDPQDFRDLRRFSGMTRREAAQALDVTERTIQNWENGGARIPWMAYRLLRILRGYALPGSAWEGWTVQGDTLYSEDGRGFREQDMRHLTLTFAQARLWREVYAQEALRERTRRKLVPFPELAVIDGKKRAGGV